MRRPALRTLWLSLAVLVSGCASFDPVTSTRNAQVAEINTKLGLDYLQKGNLNLAKSKLNRALAEDPLSSQVHWANALLEERLGDNAKADALYRKAVRLNPTDSEGLNFYGVFLCRQGNVTEALAAFEQAVKNPLFTTPEYAYTNAGICAAQNGFPAQADVYLRNALDKSPNYAMALYHMALLSYNEQRYLPARAYRQRLEQAMDATDPKVLWLCFVTEQHLGNLDEARRCEERLKRDFPTSDEANALYR
ncbi:MAG: type IV pilus biogenesis/stability protein PilW [Thiotrichales bacterium]